MRRYPSSRSSSACRRAASSGDISANSDPDAIDHIIPGNDDAIRAADLIAGAIADAVIEGKEIASKKQPAKGKSESSES